LKQIAVVGSGNWGSTVAKIIASNTLNSKKFKPEVKMWVFEEQVNGQKLTDIINTTHENPKYLPGIALPHNISAIPDLLETCTDADVLVFVLPHQFIEKTCSILKGNLKAGAYGLSLIKGVDMSPSGGIVLTTDVIRNSLEISCAVLMGANIAQEVAKELYCESTIGCDNADRGADIKDLLQTNYFRLVVCPDEVGVELCGALKNIVATGAGFCDGLNYGDNTKAAVIRLGLMEMIKFIQQFYGHRGIQERTFLESCGLADLVTTCYGGRNRRLAEMFVRTGKSIEQLEREELNGQKLQGPPTAAEIHNMLQKLGPAALATYPIFVAVHRICCGELKPSQFVDCLREHPEHL